MYIHIVAYPLPLAISRTSRWFFSSLLALVLKFQLTPCSICVSQSLCFYPDYLTWRVVRLFFFSFLSPPPSPAFCNKHCMMNWFPWNSNDLVLVISYQECWIFLKSDGRSEGERVEAPLASQFSKKGNGEMILHYSWKYILGTTLKEQRLPVFT